MQIFIRNYSNLFAILFLTLLFQSCKKSDQVASPEKDLSSLERKFFFTNRTGDLTESKLVDFLIRQNRSKSFVEKTSKVIGFPRWEKMITIKGKSEISGRGALDSLLTTYFVPFVRDSQNYVNASLIISVYSNDTTFAYRSDWEYRYKTHGSPIVDSTAEAHAVFFMFLDNKTFGYTEFNITDTSLFPTTHVANGGLKKLKILSTPSSLSGRGNSEVVSVTCFDYTVCQSISSGNRTTSMLAPICNTYTYCYSIWSTSDNGSISGGTGGGSSGGSGGTGNPGSGSPSPCPGTTSYQRGQTATYGCETGWNSTSTTSNYLTYLINILSLTSTQASFLLQNPNYQAPLYSYIFQNFSSQSVQICKEHIDLLMSKPEYVNFVNNHDITGNHSLVWWMDDNWLDNPLYFNLDPGETYKRLTAAEKSLVKQYPGAAFILREFNIPLAENFTRQKFGGNGLNDKSDAFRHACFQALNTVRVGSLLTQQFADAHESEVPTPLSLEKQMDLFNNSVGISYGLTQSWPSSNPTMIANDIYTKLLNGDLMYIKPLDFIASPRFDANNDGFQDCPTCLNGILVSSVLTPTNQ